MQKNILSIVLLFLTACSSSPVFNVVSEPIQAEIFYVTPTGEKKSIGKTPYSVPMEELRKTIKEVESGEFFTLLIEKEGFQTQTYVIPATQFGTSISQLDIKLKQGQTIEELKKAKDVLNQLFLAQKYALTLQFERAQIELDKVLFHFPDFANAMSMRAAIYYAQKNYTESSTWYEKAIKADPQMDEAIKMLAKIKTLKSGDRLPANDKDKKSDKTK